jgi:hypothetical protein
MRPHPFRRNKVLLSVALPAIAAVLITAYAVRRDQRLYNSGPVSTAHAMFGAQCEKCHVPGAAAAGLAPANAFFLSVPDKACQECHDGPKHHENQAFTPGCSSCHFEHKGRERLVELTDRQCTQCHAGLSTNDGTTRFVPKIANFKEGHGHPEFAVGAVLGKEPRTIRLKSASPPVDATETCVNHDKHVNKSFPDDFGIRDEKTKKDRKGVFRGPKGEARLGCTYCHQSDERGAYMAPVNYATHCADCHRLLFDNDRFPGVVAPHEKPEAVRAFLQAKYKEAPQGERPRAPAVKEAPADKPEEDTPRPRRRLGARDASDEGSALPRGGRGAGREEAEEAPARGAAKSVAEVETDLFFRSKASAGNDTCSYCHTLTAPDKPKPSVSCKETNTKTPGEVPNLTEPVRTALKEGRGDKLPVIVKTAMPARWLPYSRFDHRAHRAVACKDCHADALKSTATQDVLLPSITVCRECHHESAGARTACAECHRYHDQANEVVKARDPKSPGPLTIRGSALSVPEGAGGGTR